MLEKLVKPIWKTSQSVSAKRQSLKVFVPQACSVPGQLPRKSNVLSTSFHQKSHSTPSTPSIPWWLKVNFSSGSQRRDRKDCERQAGKGKQRRQRPNNYPGASCFPPTKDIPQPHKGESPFTTENKIVSDMEHSLTERASMEKTDAKHEILHSCAHTSQKPTGKHLEREMLPCVNILTQKFPKTSPESLRIKRPG